MVLCAAANLSECKQCSCFKLCVYALLCCSFETVLQQVLPAANLDGQTRRLPLVPQIGLTLELDEIFTADALRKESVLRLGK
jgi:hypothetical protein